MAGLDLCKMKRSWSKYGGLRLHDYEEIYQIWEVQAKLDVSIMVSTSVVD